MKKFLIGAAAASVLASGVAHAVEHSPYLGLALGAQMFRNKVRMAKSDAGAAWTYQSLNSNKQVLAGGVALGWAFKMNWFHMAPEIEYLFGASSKTKTKGINSSSMTGHDWVRVESRGAFNAALRMGYHYNDNLLMYVRGGVEARQFKVRGHNVFFGVTTQTMKNSHSKTRWAPAFGLGVEGNITKELSLGLEARSAFFKKKSRLVSTRLRATDTADSKTRISHRAGVDTVMLRATYRMGQLFK
ncbi:MAG: outer membrane protein [Holosporales bacterium]